MSGIPVTGVGKDTLAALRSGRVQGAAARLRSATGLLEGTFYQEMFKAMRQTIPDGGGPEGGQGESIFTSLMDQHIADVAAARSRTGIGEALYRRFAGAAGVAASDAQEG